jgi:hypothetical protein
MGEALRSLSAGRAVSESDDGKVGWVGMVSVGSSARTPGP